MGVTMVWLLLIVGFTFFGNLTVPQSLNELGDFLAGICAPIAFFWLILGYMQQAKQLEQNTQALQQQEHALQLQIEEIRESVKQQANLVEIQKQHAQDQQKLFEPIFLVSDEKVIHVMEGKPTKSEGGIYVQENYEVVVLRLYFKIQNRGKEIVNLTIRENYNKFILFKMDYLKKGDIKEVELDFPDSQIAQLNAEQEIVSDFDLSFVCENGKLINTKFQVIIFLRHDSLFGARVFI